MRPTSLVPVLALASTLGCSSSSDVPAQAANGVLDAAVAADFVMESDDFTIDPGSEKYYCYTAHMDADTAFHSFSIGSYKTVHHMFFAQTLAPEQEGLHECPVLFKTSWLPLFTTGKGATRLDLPEGSALKLKKGDQVVMQLHLLNTGPAPLTERVKISANTLDASEVRYNAALYPFGTSVFEVPPKQKSTVTHDCTMDLDMEIFVMFPHMHRLGTEMAFQVGKDAASLADVWRGKYDFDNQQLLPTKISLHAGDYTRVECNYDNPTDQTIHYGESTNTEMCFFATFIKDGPQLNGHCVDISGLDLSKIFGNGKDAGADAEAGSVP
jgi:hypothetical protein